MSHFSVMVITDTPEGLDAAMQPYHEYESTGEDDQYVVDVDITDEINKWLDREFFYGRTKEGSVLDYYYYYDDAIERLEAPIKVARHKFYEFAGLAVEDEVKKWWGCEKRGDRYMRHTNPNSKWDRWCIGGRYSWRLRVKGEEVGVDQCRVGDLDLGSMPSFCTFAVCMGGQWYERGEMGWEWEAEFRRLLESVPKDKTITIVDCHI